jgi:hypothetical protein
MPGEYDRTCPQCSAQRKPRKKTQEAGAPLALIVVGGMVVGAIIALLMGL